MFKRWANKAMETYPVVSVDTCHSYQIHQPYKYQCTQSWCRQEYGRHSKSIDVEAKACGVCNGKLEFIGKFNADGTRVEERAASAFSLFVKEHFGAIKVGGYRTLSMYITVHCCSSHSGIPLF